MKRRGEEDTDSKYIGQFILNWTSEKPSIRTLLKSGLALDRTLFLSQVLHHSCMNFCS